MMVSNKNIIDKDRECVIKDCVEFFQRHKIDYALACGTACAWLKQDEIDKPQDKLHDTDFFVRKEEYERVLKYYNEFEGKGYKINKKSPKVQMFAPYWKYQIEEYLVEFYFTETDGDYVKYKTNENNEKRDKWSWEHKI